MTPDKIEAKLKHRQEERENISKQEAQELSKNLSIKEQLEAKVKNEHITIDIPSGDSTIPLKFRKLTKKELDLILDSQRALGTAGADKQKAEEAATKIFDILEEKAKGLDGMDGMDADYWRSGDGFSADVLSMIIISLTSSSVNPTKEYVEAVTKFRI